MLSFAGDTMNKILTAASIFGWIMVAILIYLFIHGGFISQETIQTISKPLLLLGAVLGGIWYAQRN